MRSTAKDIMELYQSSNKDEIAEYFPLLMNERLNCIFQKSVEPKIADYQEVADMLNGLLELNIEAGHVKVLLDFYPYVKVKIAHNPATDAMMRDLILDAVSDFFLGCPWPDYEEENINMDNYLDALTVQFKGFSTGFEIMSQLMINQHQNTQDIQAETNSTERLSEMSNQDTVAALASAYAEENTSSLSLSFEAKEANRNTEKQVKSNKAYEDEKDDGEEDKVILSKKTYKEINGELNLFGEDMLPPEEIDKILGDEYIKSQIVAWGIDTVVRDNLFETFVGYFLPEKYSEHGVSYQEKYEKLNEAVKAYVKAFKEKKDNVDRNCSEDDEDDKIILSKKPIKK